MLYGKNIRRAFLSWRFTVNCDYVLSCNLQKCGKLHCMKSDRIRSFSGPYFPAFGLNTPCLSVFSPNAGKYGPENSKYGYFSRRAFLWLWSQEDLCTLARNIIAHTRIKNWQSLVRTFPSLLFYSTIFLSMLNVYFL